METTRPLTDEQWVYWQKLASEEHDRQSAEIEQLRAGVSELRDMLCRHVDALVDEIKHRKLLKEALSEILAWIEGYELGFLLAKTTGPATMDKVKEALRTRARGGKDAKA